MIGKFLKTAGVHSGMDSMVDVRNPLWRPGESVIKVCLLGGSDGEE